MAANILSGMVPLSLSFFLLFSLGLSLIHI